MATIAFAQLQTNAPSPSKRVLACRRIGNSGCDCAVEISRVARHTGNQHAPLHYYIIPKFSDGQADQLLTINCDPPAPLPAPAPRKALSLRPRGGRLSRITVSKTGLSHYPLPPLSTRNCSTASATARCIPAKALNGSKAKGAASAMEKWKIRRN